MKFPKKTGRRAEIDLISPGQFSPGISFMTRLSPLLAAGIVLAAAWALQGCDKNPLGTVESNGHAPSLTAPAITPASVNIDSMTANGNGFYTFSVSMQAKVTDADGNIQTVGVGVVMPGGSAPYYQLILRDDGVAPDAVAGDGIYSTSFTFTIDRSEAGTYRCQFYAVDNSGLSSNSMDIPFLVKRRNSPPIIASVAAPDTVTLPVGGTIYVTLSVAASDSDGLADIAQVYFRSLTSTNPTFKFYLLDDGSLNGAVPPFGIPSGDAVAGDGTFTLTAVLSDPGTARRTNLFAYQAIDRTGDTSATVYKYLTVK